MSNAGKYLGPHIKKGPDSYQLGPIPITAPRLPTMVDMYWGNTDWGYSEGPRRGTSSGSGKLNPLTPFIWDDLLGEHQYKKLVIDEEYTTTINKISETVKNEIKQKKIIEKKGLTLTPVNEAQKDLEVTSKLIKSKNDEYESNVEAAHSLYGLNPLFLMVDLPFRTIYDAIHAPDLVNGYFKALDKIDVAYRAALELKRISLENSILVGQLPELAKKITETEALPQPVQDRQASWTGNKLTVINTETNLRIQLLPFFLQEHIVKSAGPLDGLNHSQALEKYSTVIDAKIKLEQSEVKSYVRANKDIQSPLSKPELEALHTLVDLQTNTTLGKLWIDYHTALLHSETARQLSDTSAAFKDLAKRAKEAEAKEAEDQKKKDYIDSLNFVTAMNENILKTHGANMSKVALDFQANISGKNIRNFKDAMATFEKVRANPKAKLNTKDTNAIINALNALDKATFADNVSRLGKAFGVVGKISQATAIGEAAVTGFQTGDWKPLMLELEAMAAGIGIAAVVAVILGLLFPIWVTTSVGILSVAVLMAAAASLFDSKSVDHINNLILN